MSLAEIASIATIVSSVAVIVSVVYVAAQVRQASRNQRGTTHQMRAALSADVMLRIAESDLSEAFRAGLTGDPNITEAQFWRFFYAASAIMRTAENALSQYEDGLVTEMHFASAKASAKTFLAYPGYRALWSATRQSREPRFRAFMDELATEAASSPSIDLFAAWRARGTQAGPPA